MNPARANRDIDPHSGLVAAYPALECVVVNRPVSEAFAAHERAAVRWKRLYSFLGRAALVCIFVVMTDFAYSLTLGRHYPSPDLLRAIIAAIAGVGLCCQFALIFGRIKERWLVERFAAERLRCLKFQSFAMVAISRDAADVAANVTAFTNERLARLQQELLGGRSALDEFSPSEQLIEVKPREVCASPELIGDAFRLYDGLRLEVQAQHFGEQARLSDARARAPTFLSELTFGVGAVLAFVEIVAAAWGELGRIALLSAGAPLKLWLDFFTLLLFVSSAVLAVYQRGSAHVADTERYKHYVREIRRIRQHGPPADADGFVRMVELTEQIELRELFEFCRDVSHSNYIF